MLLDVLHSQFISTHCFFEMRLGPRSQPCFARIAAMSAAGSSQNSRLSMLYLAYSRPNATVPHAFCRCATDVEALRHGSTPVLGSALLLAFSSSEFATIVAESQGPAPCCWVQNCEASTRSTPIFLLGDPRMLNAHLDSTAARTYCRASLARGQAD